MKVLYAIQGTGNGHISRAREIVPILKSMVPTDVLISGYQAEVEFPFNVDYRYNGLSFIFGKKGGIDLVKTFKKSNLFRLVKEIINLPVKKYDLVINDFEPVSAWACMLKGVKCVGLSHQAAVISLNAPKPNHTDWIGKAILHNYAPTKKNIGFHFKAYNKSTFTPVIRQEIRQLETTKQDFYLVYLPAYSDEILTEVFTKISSVRWHVFSKHAKSEKFHKNVWIRPINNGQFIQNLAACNGLLCGAGFEAPAEALYLKKKLLVIPMKMQYEQACNAAALREMGVFVLQEFNASKIPFIAMWIKKTSVVNVNYQDNTKKILIQLLQENLNYIEKSKSSLEQPKPIFNY